MNQGKKSVLVTGANGFIGSNILPELQKKFKVFTAPPSNLLDIRNKEEVLKLPESHFVIHLAGIANVPISWKNPDTAISVNTVGTVNILEYCVKTGAKLIYPSSYPYGSPQYLPTDERHPTRAENPYAVSKLAAELLCEVYHNRYGLDVTVLRIFNVYGPGQPRHMIVPQMAIDLINNNSIEVQTGKPKRDMVFISDVVEAFLLSLDKAKGFSVYNVGSGRNYSIEELAMKLINISKKKCNFIDKKNPRSNDILETLADVSKINKELRWGPKVSIDEGLEITYSWFLNRFSN